MPRKKKTGNVIDFPQKNENKEELGQELEQKAEEGIAQVIQRIFLNRKAGLEKLEKCASNYDNRPLISGEDAEQFNENMLRDVEAGIRAAFLTVEALSGLTDMLRHDLVGIIQEAEAVKMAGIQTSAYVQTLLALLEEKGVISDDEMRTMWNKVVPSYLEKLNRGPTQQ